MAVQRQAMWSNLAHEMTAEFRGLCAEEVYQLLKAMHQIQLIYVIYILHIVHIPSPHQEYSLMQL